MSIASRITEMEQHIGNAYDKIEDLGIDLTDVDKNINNISSMLENVWDEYPKVTATDVEEASINGTKKGRINIDLKGNTEQDGEPTLETPIPIKNVTGQANVKIQNKNLFDGEIELGSINPANGTLIPNADRTRSKNFTKVKPNTIYTISVQEGQYRWIVGYTANKEGITDGNVSGQASALSTFPVSIYSTTNTFTTTATTEYIKWYDTSSTNLSEKVQLEQGSTATSYVEHQEQNYPFTFSEGQILGNNEELKDNGKDDIWGEYIFTGNENWVDYPGTQTGDFYKFYTTGVRLGRTNNMEARADAFCTHFINNNFYANDNGIGLTQNATYISIDKTIASTPNELKTFFAIQYNNGNPVKVQYKKKNPTVTAYTETQQAQYNAIKQARSYDDITYITSTSDELAFIMDVEILSDGVSSSNTRTLALGSLNEVSLDKGSLNNIKEVDTEDAEDETSVESEE
jgi:hypothetical protein